MRVVFAALLITVSLAEPAQAKPVGFQSDLADGQHIECSLTKSTLTCLNYTATPGKACDAGGAVAALVLTRNATKTRPTTYCVDEGYHGWSKLKAGHSWTKNGFTCRLRKKSAALSCTNAKKTFVLWTAKV